MSFMLKLFDWVFGLLMRFPLLFWAAMVANIIGVIGGGWFWYGPMLVNAPWWAILFIPDCPLAALWATIAFVLIRYDREARWFNALAAFACLKYGLWTIAFWLRHWLGGGEIEFIGVGMFITHIGLTCEGILLARRVLPLNWLGRLPAIGLHATAWLVDYALIGFAVRNYGFPFYPPLTPFVPVSFVATVAGLLVIGLSIGLLALPNQQPSRLKLQPAK